MTYCLKIGPSKKGKWTEFFYDFCNDNCSGDPNRGICGYVGLALLLGYIDYYKSSDFMNDVYYAYDKGLFNNNVSFSLSYYLYCLDSLFINNLFCLLLLILVRSLYSRNYILCSTTNINSI